MENKGITIPLILLLIVGVILLFVISRLQGPKDPVANITQKVAQVVTGGSEFNITSDTPGYENYLELDTGCPSKDCIPSIDNPNFESVTEADTWLDKDDIVFVLDHNDIIRAYPQRILNWHEIVNDTIDDDPIAVTFCPLCGSALAFDRNIDQQTLTFGVSGKLHNNDLVMYDRQTESLWQQITGEAIVGKLFGTKLTQIPLTGMRWSEFRQKFPEGQSLSTDTGFSRDYDRYPYGDYEQNSRVNFPQEGGVDSTIFPKTVVYGVEINGNYKAYPLEKIEEQETIFDTLGGINIHIDYNNGDVEIIRSDIGIELPATRLFWFAWKSFRPDTELY